MLKILQARLQQCMAENLQLYTGRGIKLQITNIHWIIKKAREFQKNTSPSASLTTLKPLTVWITTNWKIFKEMGIPDDLTCLLRNLYAGQEGTVKWNNRLVPTGK